MLLGMIGNVNAQQKWSFSSVSATDQANLNADTENWTYDSSNSRWTSKAIITDEALNANNVELEFTKGLKFTLGAVDYVRVDRKKNCLTLNNKLAKVTISGVKAGQVLTVKCQSSSSSTARKITATNITVTSGFEESTSSTTNVGTVKEDGSIILQSTGGLYVYSIEVTNPGEEDGGDEPAGDDLSVAQSTMNNQAVLTLSDQTKRYYNTAELTSIDIDGTNVKIVKGNNSYTFANKVTDISFTKGVPVDGGEEGNYNNTQGKVKINEAKGWLESAYVKFALFEGATSYNVYVKGGQYADYTKIDGPLVRSYGTYGRADVVGLKADSYSLKIVPVNADGEMAEAANEVTSLVVKNYDRGGFAHMNWTKGIGAYKDDGALKQGAKVIYVTKDNFNTCTLEMVKDNKGNMETFVGIGNILQAKKKGYDTTPLSVRIIGQITASNADAAQRMTDQKGLQIKSDNDDTDLAVTIEGIGDDAIFDGFGLGVDGGCDVEVRNMAFKGQGSSDDNMEIKGTQHIWVHHCDFFYGMKGSGDHDKGDGSLDCKDKCTFATFSYNHFWDAGKAMLCGMKSEVTTNLLSYHHNWFDHSDSRHPRVRTSTVHVYNNYFDGIGKYGVGATMGSSVFVENNYFRGTFRPMMSSKQGTDATGDGTFSGENGGIIKSFGNVFAEKPKNFSFITYQTNNTSFDAYEATTRGEVVPSTVVTLAGNTTYNNFDTDPSLMHDGTVDAAGDVPSIVTGYYGAGRLNHGDIEYTFTNSTDDADYGRIAGLDNILSNYKSSLVGIFGDETSQGGGEPGGGDEPGGDEPETPEGTIVASFDGSPSYSMFTVGGDYGDGKITYNGTYYKKGVKLNSKGSIKFTPTQNYTMTIVLATSKDGKTVKINGTASPSAGADNTEGKYREITGISLTSGTEYTLTVGDKESIVMLIILEPKS